MPHCYRCHLGLDATKPVFGVSDKARLKPVSSATESSYKIEMLLVVSLDKVLSNKQITKTLIRLRGCTGWSAPLLLANPEGRFSWLKVFSCRRFSCVAGFLVSKVLSC